MDEQHKPAKNGGNRNLFARILRLLLIFGCIISGAVGIVYAVVALNLPDRLLLYALIAAAFGSGFFVLYVLQRMLKQAFPLRGISAENNSRNWHPAALVFMRWLVWWMYFLLLLSVRPFDMLPTIEDLDMARSRIQTSIFGYPSLPPYRPPVAAVVEEEDDGWYVQRLNYELPLGFVSRVYCYHPENPNGEAVIYHQGHSPVPGEPETIETFLNRGYVVCMVVMPMRGNNTTPSPYRHGGFHNQFWHIPLEQPLQIFVEPAIQTRYWLEHEGYSIALMMGISGGGWTTIVSAAIDTQIPLSVSIAGSLPLPYRDRPPDFEQTLPGIAYGYTDLYVLAAENRTHIAIHNDVDSCCYRLNREDFTWIERVQALSADNNGVYEVREYRNDDHSILPEMIDWVYETYMKPEP